MSQSLKQFEARYRAEIERELFRNLPASQQRYTERFNDALHYAIFPGGKRWRPLLTLIGGFIVNAPLQSLLPAACAIEYLHSSSMIIDDLPMMDDADLRRGKSTMHLAYGESTALLTSLALMNHSYSLLSVACRRAGNSEASGRLIQDATDCIGANGMIGGQVVDLELRSDDFGVEGLASRNLKTTALMRLMLTCGAIASGASTDATLALAKFGNALGMAYQICDDLMDDVSGLQFQAKTANQDRRHLRSTFVSEFGVVGAHRMAVELIDNAVELLMQKFGDREEVHLLATAASLILNMRNIKVNQPDGELMNVS